MKSNLLCILAVMSLSGCSGESREYQMSVKAAEAKLLAANFERSILPGSTLLKPDVMRNYEGTLEWQVLDDSENGNGWWCPLVVEPAAEDGKTVRVVNNCAGIMARFNEKLDELVDATLTGRKPHFE